MERLIGEHLASHRDEKVPPFLKWAGGKRWFAPKIRELIRPGYDRFVEPFLGSAAVFFELKPKRGCLSDLNEDLVNAYRAIKEDWRTVRRLLSAHDKRHCVDYYYEIRGSSPGTSNARAARFIYLNRTCWNGLYRVNKQGEFNVPIGTKARAVIDTDDFEQVADALTYVELAVQDFQVAIDRCGDGDLVFADPPYTVRHKHNGFVKYNEVLFSWADQERLAESLVRAKKRGAQIICTNADHQSIRELYESNFVITEACRYSAISSVERSRGRYSELIISG